jgi:hypothetical protein
MSYPRPIKHHLIVLIIFAAVSRRATCALKVNLASGNIASTSRIITTKKDIYYPSHKTTIFAASKADTVPRNDDNEESIINDGSSNNNVTANYTPILPPLSTDVKRIFQTPKDFIFTTRSKEQRQQQTKKTNSSLLPSRDSAEDNVFSSSSNNKKSKNNSILENFIFPSSSKIQSKSSSKKSDDNNSNATKKTPLSLFSASLSASLIYPLPDRNETLTSGTKASSLYSSSILDGVLPVSELFYRSTQSLVDDSTSTTSSCCDEEDSIGTSAVKKDKTTGNAIFSAASNNNNSNNRRPNQATNSRFGDDEELPFSAEQSDRLTSKGINKINVRRNEADTFTTPVASSGDSNNNAIEGGRSNKSEVLSFSSTTNSTITTVTTTTSTATSGNKGGSGSTRKISSYGVRTSRYLNTKYNSTTTNSTRAGSPSPRRGNHSSSSKQRSNSSGKIIRRGMEMLVGGEPINADPPLKSIEIRYDASISDW